MRQRASAVLAVTVNMALAFGGCQGGGDDEARTTVPTAPSTSTTSTTAVSYAVPATIDQAYIEKVMAALDRVYGDAARYMAQKRAPDEEFLRILGAAFGGDSFSFKQQIWGQVVNERFRLLRPSPGDAKTDIRRVLIAEPACILFEAGRDFFAIFNEPDPPGPPRYVGLVPLPPSRDARGVNPTPWLITFDGGIKEQREPTREEACTAP